MNERIEPLREYRLNNFDDSLRESHLFPPTTTGIEVLQINFGKLCNQVGFWAEKTRLVLNLVYNPAGTFLPPSQAGVEAGFKLELFQHCGIRFNHLFTIANMPIGRFSEFLIRTGNYESYLERLIAANNPQAAAGVMCRCTLSVGRDGSLYDCDFNRMLELNCDHGDDLNIIFEGAGTKWIGELENEGHKLH